MGASNRTLLSKLGFADADRKSSRHDRACNYLVLKPEALIATLSAALPANLKVKSATGIPEFHVTKGDGKYATTVGFVDVFATYAVEREFRLRRPVEPIAIEGNPAWMRFRARLEADPVFGSYPRNGGDAVVPNELWQRYCDWKAKVHGEIDAELAQERKASEQAYRERVEASPRDLEASVVGDFQAIIEVKIAKVSSGDLIRQMRVYKEFTQLKEGARRGVLPEKWASAWGEERDSLMRFETAEPRNLLRDCSGKSIAVVDFDVDDEYRQACLAANVHIVRLGRGFEEFLASTPAPSPSGPITEI